MKIRTRLFLTILLIVGFGFYRLSGWVLEDLRPRYLETMEETMVDTAVVLASITESWMAIGSPVSSDIRTLFSSASDGQLTAKIYQVTKTNLQMRIYVTDAGGVVLYDSDAGRDEGRDYSKWNNIVRTLRGEYGARATRTVPKDPGSVVLHVSAPIRKDGRIAGVLTVAKPASSISMFVDESKRKIISAGVVAGVVVIALLLIVSIWITWPIKRLTEYARQVRDGKKSQAPDFGSSDIGELGRAFEQMRDSLEGREYVENYIQTLTHEMKSPLSAIRSAAELLKENMPPDRRERFIGNICEESARMQDLIERLLQLSALEKKKVLDEAADVELGALVADAAASLSSVATGRGIRINIEPYLPVVRNCEKFLIRQSVVNLLQNAIEFSPSGSQINIRVSQSGEKAVIIVEDSGSGIPDYALQKIFDRFYSLDRPDTGRKSSGLGLAFVREVMALHSGEINIANRPGGGTKASMVF